MNIAIVVLNYNGKNLLEKFIPSLVKFSPENSVFVIDNASTDDSVAFLTENFPSVQIIRNSENYGFAKGYNEGLKTIKADVFCLINSDVLVSEHWISPVLEMFSAEENTAVIQPKILSFKELDFFEYAGAAGGFLDRFGFAFCRGRIFDTLEKDENQYQNDKIFWASGACFFIRREVFFAQGGFDEDFFAHQEEIDLCWRVNLMQKDIKYCSQSVIYHIGGATLSAENPKKVFLNFRNNLLVLLKNLHKSELFYIIFLRLILDGIAGIKFLLEGKIHFTFQIIKAHFSFYQHFIKFYKKRKNPQKIKYFSVNSVVFDYFLKKKTHFKDLKTIPLA